MGEKVTLHEEIRDILESQGNRWMTTSDLAGPARAKADPAGHRHAAMRFLVGQRAQALPFEAGVG